METYGEMIERHKREIEELQENCDHPEESDWLEHHWAMGHSSGFDVKVCSICDANLHTRRWCSKEGCEIEIIDDDIFEGDGHAQPMGSYYCEEHVERCGCDDCQEWLDRKERKG